MAEGMLARVLPEVFREAIAVSAPLRALLAAADDMSEPVMVLLDRVDAVVDPYRVPEPLVPYLSRWVDLDWLTIPVADAATAVAHGVPTPRQRDLIAAAADLSARRGTPAGLQRFLHLATGVDGFEVDGVPGAFHVLVRVPAEAAAQVDLVRRIVAATKPAHVTHEVVVGGAA